MAKKTKKSKIEKKAAKKAAKKKAEKKWPRGSQRIGIFLQIPRFLRRDHNAPRPPRPEAPHRGEDIRATIKGTAVLTRRIKMRVATHAGADLSSSVAARRGTHPITIANHR
jgi:hypothetical protein